MSCDRRGGAGVHVGRRTHFEGDTTVANVVRETTEAVVAVLLVNVVGNAYPVTQALGVAELHGLPDRRETEVFARVNGEMKVFALDEVKCAQVLGRWKTILGSGNVKAADAFVAKVNGQLCDGLAERRLAHSGEQRANDDAVALVGRLFHPQRETVEH